jgi:hypothetical protein
MEDTERPLINNIVSKEFDKYFQREDIFPKGENSGSGLEKKQKPT